MPLNSSSLISTNVPDMETCVVQACKVALQTHFMALQAAHAQDKAAASTIH
jgi:hypothetical protein